MARSIYPTWLSLDEFAAIIGISPLAFNQLESPSLQRTTTCGEIFFSDSWQHSDRIGRNDIALAIKQAEEDISREVGFNLLPDWTLEERLPYPHPAPAELYGIGINPRWQMKSVEANRGYLISGGVRAKTLIQAGATFTRTDVDTDGYAETCTLNVTTTVTDVNEIHLYYPAQDGSDEWEIRPIKVTINNGIARIIFKSWQVAAANQMDDLRANVLNADIPTSYETTVDVYRVYNDPSTQAQFLWENMPGDGSCGSCYACQLGSQSGCFHFRDPRMGFLVPAPASYDSSTGLWTSTDWLACREPDQIRLWYYSGFRDPKLTRSYVELTPFWKAAIAYYACSKFDRPACGCDNVNQFIDKWRADAAFASEKSGQFNMTAEMGANKFGTTMGALYAWRAVQKNGVRVYK